MRRHRVHRLNGIVMPAGCLIIYVQLYFILAHWMYICMHGHGIKSVKRIYATDEHTTLIKPEYHPQEHIPAHLECPSTYQQWLDIHIPEENKYLSLTLRGFSWHVYICRDERIHILKHFMFGKSTCASIPIQPPIIFLGYALDNHVFHCNSTWEYTSCHIFIYRSGTLCYSFIQFYTFIEKIWKFANSLCIFSPDKHTVQRRFDTLNYSKVQQTESVYCAVRWRWWRWQHNNNMYIIFYLSSEKHIPYTTETEHKQ